jgi:hypothetical protein
VDFTPFLEDCKVRLAAEPATHPGLFLRLGWGYLGNGDLLLLLLLSLCCTFIACEGCRVLDGLLDEGEGISAESATSFVVPALGSEDLILDLFGLVWRQVPFADELLYLFLEALVLHWIGYFVLDETISVLFQQLIKLLEDSIGHSRTSDDFPIGSFHQRLAIWCGSRRPLLWLLCGLLLWLWGWGWGWGLWGWGWGWGLLLWLWGWGLWFVITVVNWLWFCY